MERNPDFSQLKKLAGSNSGQQLLELLRHKGGDSLDNALTQAAQGDYTQAMALLGGLLADPEAKRLLGELEAIL